MNLNAIKRACMDTRFAAVMNADDRSQWITNGNTAYLVEGVRVDAEAIPHLFNLSEKQRGKLVIEEIPTHAPRFRSHEMPGEEPARELGAIMYLGALMLALRTSRGVLYIPYDRIKHIKDENRRCFVRWQNGKPMVAVYGDMFSAVLILPLNNQSAVEVNAIARGICADGDIYQWPDAEQEAATAEAQAEAMLRRMDQGEESH